MKTLLVAMISLASMNSFATSSASLDYSCELDRVTQEGNVAISDQVIAGEASCMTFDRGQPLCLRLERTTNINTINISLRYEKNLTSPLEKDFISSTNIAFLNGATSINKVKAGFLRKSELTCQYKNLRIKR
jgi:hypothetical protein